MASPSTAMMFLLVAMTVVAAVMLAMILFVLIVMMFHMCLCPDEVSRCRPHFNMRYKCNHSDNNVAAAVHPAKQLH